jgi:hypothetical protein
MIDIAVAASTAFRLARRSLCNFDVGKHENRCNDMTTPKSAEIKASATPGQLTPLQNIFGIRNRLGDWNLSTLELEQN